MSYKHILVAMDPSEDSKLLLDKAVLLAKATGADLSFMSADEVYGVDHAEKLEAHKEVADYPIKNILVGDDSISERIEKAVKDEGVDLVVCFHHHDFWHSLFSTAADLMKAVDVDLFVVSVR
ncbi:universal stress protein [Vibrio sp. HN007]|uniref:universal stress protein n=1 Tax=Vibrio iocasae TaxID=3098914 RepID=UPI0035D410AD